MDYKKYELKLRLMKNRKSWIYNSHAGHFIAWFIAFSICSLCSYVNGANAFIQGHGPMIIGIFIGAALSTRIHAYQEAARIEVFHIKINHTARFFQRAGIAILIGLLAHVMAEGFGNGAYIKAAACAFFIGSIFWLIFDVMLNYDRGHGLFYVSSWYKTAWIDKQFSKTSPTFRAILWLASKIILFIVGIMLYEWSFNF